jgi:hypothetical protein
MGRPPATLTEHQVAEVETLAAVLTTEQMADYFGIGRRTFYALMEREPEIAGRYKRGKARAIGSIAQSLITKARAGDTASMIFFLKTQGGWRETSRIEHVDDAASQTIDLSALSDEALSEMIAVFGAADDQDEPLGLPAAEEV